MTSDVSVSIKLTQKQTGKLYMNYLARGERIKAMRESLKCIVVLAEGSRDFAIATAAKAALEPKFTRANL